MSQFRIEQPCIALKSINPVADFRNIDIVASAFIAAGESETTVIVCFIQENVAIEEVARGVQDLFLKMGIRAKPFSYSMNGCELNFKDGEERIWQPPVLNHSLN